MNQIVMITGASSGIGKATAKRLLASHFKVYAVARRQEAMEDLKALGAEVLHMDVTDESSIDRVMEILLQNEGRIDILINNAGYGSTGSLEDVPLSEAQGQFDVNVFGLMRVTKAVLPAMRAQGSGKIINLSSVGGKFATPLSGWYNATKFCVEALSDSLRREVSSFGIQVVLIEPGGINTGWPPEAAQAAQRNSGHTAYGPMVSRFVRNLRIYEHQLSDPAIVADLIEKAIRSSRPRTRYVGGFGARPLLLLRRLLPPKIMDAIVRSQYG
jgi:NAD(P)-dependent dehydrogenase (short-subunit alcohol dehydrogenase family)